MTQPQLIDRTCVLVVDDNVDIREAMQDALQAAGYRVETAIHGDDARKLLQRIRPGAIILDLWMPVMDGVRLHALLQADPLLATIPVVVVTAVPRDAPPGVKVFAKPVTMAKLLEWVAEHCDKA